MTTFLLIAIKFLFFLPILTLILILREVGCGGVRFQKWSGHTIRGEASKHILLHTYYHCCYISSWVDVCYFLTIIFENFSNVWIFSFLKCKPDCQSPLNRLTWFAALQPLIRFIRLLIQWLIFMWFKKRCWICWS